MFSPTLLTHLEFWADRIPDQAAVCTGDGQLTWSELAASSHRIAAGLLALGVQQGDRVGILMHNRVEFAAALLGILRAGGIVTLLNIRNTASELTLTLQDAGIGVVLTEACFADTLAACACSVEPLRCIYAEPVAGALSIAALGELAQPLAIAPPLHADTIAFICYTSGTTGVPKGAMFSHRNLLDAAFARIIALSVNQNDKLLLSLPMAYTGGLVLYIRDALITGATTYLESSIDPDRLLDVIERERITLWPAVPVVYERVLAHPRARTADFSHLRHASMGGASVSLHLLDEFAKLGVGVTQGYGLTESSGSYVAVLTEADAFRKQGFAGKPVVNLRVRIVDENGSDVPRGTSGEILVSGPTVMRGYYNRPEETAKTIVDGWLHTGDIGELDADGYLKIIDRKKDMLISGGLNVYPAELERVLAGVPGLEEFVVVGVADEQWGEVPMIVAHAQVPLDVDALATRCSEHLSDYKRPKYYVDVGSPLPRTYSGKILKRALQETYTRAPAEAHLLRRSSVS